MARLLAADGRNGARVDVGLNPSTTASADPGAHSRTDSIFAMCSGIRPLIFPCSRFFTVLMETPAWAASSVCVRPRSRRARLTNTPRRSYPSRSADLRNVSTYTVPAP